MFAVGAFDTFSESSQIQYCSVGEWDGVNFDKVGEGLCPRGSDASTTVQIQTVILGDSGDIFVGGTFESRVWDGHHFVRIMHVAKFDSVKVIWLPLRGGELKCQSGDSPRVNALAWDSNNKILYIGGIFDTIDDTTISSGVAYWSASTGLMPLVADSTGFTQSLLGKPGIVSDLAFEPYSQSLFVAGAFTEINGNNCVSIAVWHRKTNEWLCLFQPLKAVTPITAMFLDSTSSTTTLYISGWALATSDWFTSSNITRPTFPYAVASLDLQGYIDERAKKNDNNNNNNNNTNDDNYNNNTVITTNYIPSHTPTIAPTASSNSTIDSTDNNNPTINTNTNNSPTTNTNTNTNTNNNTTDATEPSEIINTNTTTSITMSTAMPAEVDGGIITHRKLQNNIHQQQRQHRQRRADFNYFFKPHDEQLHRNTHMITTSAAVTSLLNQQSKQYLRTSNSHNNNNRNNNRRNNNNNNNNRFLSLWQWLKLKTVQIIDFHNKNNKLLTTTTNTNSNINISKKQKSRKHRVQRRVRQNNDQSIGRNRNMKNDRYLLNEKFAEGTTPTSSPIIYSPSMYNPNNNNTNIIYSNNSNTNNTNNTYSNNTSTSSAWHAEWKWLPGFIGCNGPVLEITRGQNMFAQSLFIVGAFNNFPSVVIWSNNGVTGPKITTLNSKLSLQGLVTSVSQLHVKFADSVKPSPNLPEGNDYTFLVLISCVLVGVFLGISVALGFRFSNYSKLSTGDLDVTEDGVPVGGITLKTLSGDYLSNGLDFKDCFERAMKARHLPTHESLLIINPKEIVLSKIIGEGSFGRVWSGQWRNSSVAVKEFVFAQAAIVGGSIERNKLIEEIVGEAGVMACLRHPKILQLYGCSLTLQAVWIVSELCIRGSLRAILNDSNLEIPMIRRLSICLDVADGMMYLHTRTPPIIHRDLKSQNIFITEPQPNHFIAKIGDWGSARAVALSGAKSMTHGVGTACWLAPEVINYAHFSKDSDVYAFGIVLWEIFTRQDVYEGYSAAQIISKVAHEGLRPRVPPGNICGKLMSECWHQKPSERPGFHRILKKLSKMYAQVKTQVKAEKTGTGSNPSSTHSGNNGGGRDFSGDSTPGKWLVDYVEGGGITGAANSQFRSSQSDSVVESDRGIVSGVPDSYLSLDANSKNASLNPTKLKQYYSLDRYVCSTVFIIFIHTLFLYLFIYVYKCSSMYFNKELVAATTGTTANKENQTGQFGNDTFQGRSSEISMSFYRELALGARSRLSKSASPDINMPNRVAVSLGDKKGKRSAAGIAANDSVSPPMDPSDKYIMPTRALIRRNSDPVALRGLTRLQKAGLHPHVSGQRGSMHHQQPKTSTLHHNKPIQLPAPTSSTSSGLQIIRIPEEQYKALQAARTGGLSTINSSSLAPSSISPYSTGSPLKMSSSSHSLTQMDIFNFNVMNANSGKSELNSTLLSQASEENMDMSNSSTKSLQRRSIQQHRDHESTSPYRSTSSKKIKMNNNTTTGITSNDPTKEFLFSRDTKSTHGVNIAISDSQRGLYSSSYTDPVSRQDIHIPSSSSSSSSSSSVAEMTEYETILQQQIEAISSSSRSSGSNPIKIINHQESRDSSRSPPTDVTPKLFNYTYKTSSSTNNINIQKDDTDIINEFGLSHTSSSVAGPSYLLANRGSGSPLNRLFPSVMTTASSNTTGNEAKDNTTTTVQVSATRTRQFSISSTGTISPYLSPVRTRTTSTQQQQQQQQSNDKSNKK